MKINYRNVKKLATEKGIAIGFPKEFVKEHIDDYDIKFLLEDGTFDDDEDADAAAEHYLDMSYYGFTLLTLDDLKEKFGENHDDCETLDDFADILVEMDSIRKIYVYDDCVIVEPTNGEEGDGMFVKGWWYGLERI